MLIVVTEPCCRRLPFEEHKEDCYFKRERRKMDKFIKGLIDQFGQVLKGE